MSSQLSAWLLQPAGLLAVYVPLLASLGLLLVASVRRRLTWRHLVWCSALLPPTYWLSWTTAVGVHLVPLFGVWALWQARYRQMSAAVAYALTFLSCLAVDLMFAHQLSVGGRPHYAGIGGMGLADALFLMPAVAGGGVLLLHWEQARRHAAAPRRSALPETRPRWRPPRPHVNERGSTPQRG